MLCLLWKIRACLSVFLSETFETCSSLLQDFQPNSSELKEDAIQAIIEHLQLKQRRPQTLMLAKGQSQQDIHPTQIDEIRLVRLLPLCPHQL